MARKNSTRRRRRPARSKVQLAPHIQERIAAERRKLQRAAAVLLALVYSSDRGLDSEQAGDIASTALDLVEQSIAALDVVQLRAGGVS